MWSRCVYPEHREREGEALFIDNLYVRGTVPKSLFGRAWTDQTSPRIHAATVAWSSQPPTSFIPVLITIGTLWPALPSVDNNITAASISVPVLVSRCWCGPTERPTTGVSFWPRPPKKLDVDVVSGSGQFKSLPPLWLPHSPIPPYTRRCNGTEQDHSSSRLRGDRLEGLLLVPIAPAVPLIPGQRRERKIARHPPKPLPTPHTRFFLLGRNPPRHRFNRFRGALRCLCRATKNGQDDFLEDLSLCAGGVRGVLLCDTLLAGSGPIRRELGHPKNLLHLVVHNKQQEASQLQICVLQPAAARHHFRAGPGEQRDFRGMRSIFFYCVSLPL